VRRGSYLDIGIIVTITAVIGVIFWQNPLLARDIYTNTVFATLRRFLGDRSIWFLLILWLIAFIAFFRYHSRPSKYAATLSRWIFKILAPFILLIVLFYWMWGYNYLAVKPEQLIIQSRGDTISVAVLLAQFQLQTIEVNQLRDQMNGLDLNTLSGDSLIEADQARWSKSVARVLSPYGYNVKFKPRLVSFEPAGLLLRFGTAGFYNFFRVRPCIDGELHPIQIPGVGAHELAHAYGISDEGSANFVAYLAGTESKDLLSRYSAELSLWNYLRHSFSSADTIQSRLIESQVSPLILGDLQDIRRRMDRYPDIAPELRNSVYNLFLKSQGVTEGIASYDRYVGLVLAWKRQESAEKAKK